MKRKITSMVLFLLFGACLSPSPSAGQILQGPILDQEESDWKNFGLLFRAESDVFLTSVHYPNRGLADSVELRLHSDGTLLSAVPVPAGTPDATVTFNYPLKAGLIYELISTTSGNRYWTEFSAWPLASSEITVLYSYGNMYTYVSYWFAFDMIMYETVREIGVDIKPGSDQNNINLKSKGKIAVAALTTAEFEAFSAIDPESVLFAGARPVQYNEEDADGDGDTDFVFHFETKSLTELNGESTEAVLTGTTYEGISLRGSDSVTITPGKK